jgi:uncharacterized membrane protein (UPF0127 family)
VRIQNTTRGTEVAAQARAARTFFSRFLGLMGRKKLDDNAALLLEPCSSIHTAFMRFPIDVIYTDRAGQVVKVRPSIKPFRVSAAGRGGHATIELPAGALARSGTQPGDQLVFEN